MIRLMLLISLIITAPNTFQFNGIDEKKCIGERLKVDLAIKEGRESQQEAQIAEKLNHLDYAKKLIDVSV